MELFFFFRSIRKKFIFYIVNYSILLSYFEMLKKNEKDRKKTIFQMIVISCPFTSTQIIIVSIIDAYGTRIGKSILFFFFKFVDKTICVQKNYYTFTL